MAGTTTSSVPTTPRESDVAALVVEHNKLIDDVSRLLAAHVGDGNITVVTPSIGTTVTLAVPASVIQINGVATLLAALTAQGFGALGTIPAGKWGVIGAERIAAGTCTFTSGANNYTSGYNTEAEALAALPAQSADKVLVGYLTIQGGAGGWIAATSALAGGSGGTPAAATNYYPGTGLYAAALYTAAKIGDRTGTART
jgi:hypothetical protein